MLSPLGAIAGEVLTVVMVVVVEAVAAFQSANAQVSRNLTQDTNELTAQGGADVCNQGSQCQQAPGMGR